MKTNKHERDMLVNGGYIDLKANPLPEFIGNLISDIDLLQAQNVMYKEILTIISNIDDDSPINIQTLAKVGLERVDALERNEE